MSDAEQLAAANSKLVSIRVWAEMVNERHSDERVRHFAQMLLGLLDGTKPAFDEDRP